MPQGPRLDPTTLTFELPGGPVRLSDYLERACVDAFVALHRGRVVIEHYAPHMDAAQPHLWASMAKNVVGLLAHLLAHAGTMRLDAPLATWVPELAGTPIGDATMQQNLDMEVAVGWPAALPPDVGLFAAIGTLARPEGAPASIAEYVQRCQQAVPFESGACWYYQNGSPEAVAWAIRRATGRPLAWLLSELVWAPLGCEDDGDWIVDEVGAEFASGGLATTARDLARFVELLRTRGRAGDAQIVPETAVEAMLAPVDNRARFARGHLAPGRDGYAYRNYVYHVNDANRALQGVGRFGQWFHVDPVRELTVVQFASRPDAAARPIAPAPLPPLPQPEFEGRWIVDIARAVGEAAVRAD
ncbi:MAG: class C beta-lactamase-related serine hydrolase [Burkholderiales bacterium]|nr:MAG: class C beta-lactamase-related serine hydrolase [Burkholderiales bacterium]